MKSKNKRISNIINIQKNRNNKLNRKENSKIYKTKEIKKQILISLNLTQILHIYGFNTLAHLGCGAGSIIIYAPS